MKTTNSLDTTAHRPTYQKPNFLRKLEKSKTPVNEIISLIDQIYSINRKDKYFILKTIGIKKINERYGITAFDTSGATRYLRYGSFEILEYLNSDFASFAFQKNFETINKYVTNYLQETDEGIPVDENIISKSGIVFILKDKYIISKLRRCNDNWKQNEMLEQLLIEKLFQSKPPAEKYFIRACCSCPNNKQMELR